MENSKAVPQQIKNLITMWSSKPTLNTLWEEFKVGSGRDIGNTHVHSNIIHDSQKVRSTQESINSWLNKQNVAYTYVSIQWVIIQS